MNFKIIIILLISFSVDIGLYRYTRIGIEN